MTGIVRPIANASRSSVPNSAEPMPAATPSITTSAGVQAGQTATENDPPNPNAPQLVAARFARIGICGSAATRRNERHDASPRVAETTAGAGGKPS